MRGKLLRIGRFLFLCLIVFIFTFSVTTANAQTLVFSNFDVANCNSLRNVMAEDWWTSSIAFPFQPSASGYVSDIWLQAALSFSSVSDILEVALMTDSAGLPGTVMETWTFNVPKSIPGTLLHGIGTGTTAILEGVTYWLAATLPTGTTDTSVGWCTSAEMSDYSLKNAIGFIGGWYYAGGSNACAFRVAVSDCNCYEVYEVTYTNADNPEDVKVELTNFCFNFEEHTGKFGMWNLSLFFDSMNKEALAYGISAGVPVAYLKFHGDQLNVVTGIYNFYGNQWVIRGHKVSSENCPSG